MDNSTLTLETCRELFERVTDRADFWLDLQDSRISFGFYDAVGVELMSLCVFTAARLRLLGFRVTVRVKDRALVSFITL